MRALLTQSGPRAAPTSTGGEIRYKLAENQEERAAAFRLCHDAYVQAGLMLPRRCRMRVMPHHLLPTSTVFIAVRGGCVISTVSLIGDGQLGLPMECAYRKEVAALRSPSRWLGEVSALASDRKQPVCQFQLVGNLTRLMAQYARRHGIEHLLAAVHPRHSRFYQRALGFQSLGEAKPYPAVRHRPSVALVLDLPQLQREQHPSYVAYFREPIPEEQLRYSPISGADRKFFSLIANSGRPPALGGAVGNLGQEFEASDERTFARASA